MRSVSAALLPPSYEALQQVKRRHTDAYPALRINPTATLRNRIVQFLGTQPLHRCTREAFDAFCETLAEDEEVGRVPHRSWVSSNLHLVKRVKVGNAHYLRLTENGRRVLAHLEVPEENPEAAPADGEEQEEVLEQLDPTELRRRQSGIQFVGGPWVGDGGNPSPMDGSAPTPPAGPASSSASESRLPALADFLAGRKS